MMYEVKGTFRIGEKRQAFAIKVTAASEKLAVEKACSRLGSNHKCKRRFIKVEGVSVAKQ